MKRNNKNLKSGMSLAVMLGSMAIIASVFGYFVCSWFLDYVTAPEEGIKSVANDQIVTEEKIDADNQANNRNQIVLAEKVEEDDADKEEEEEAEDTIVNQNMNQDLYVVQVGAFAKQINAQGLVKELQSKGFTAYITSKDPYRVQVGAFRTKEAAEELGLELKNYGFPIYIKH
ncbi:sporulation protein [Orenia metallireducens]|uniref:Sporulation protein n=1 Tax=Orenia metallireducens TaxID=1413210 RepID=A0A1C0A5A6_9FIRM|nr:SPOR domain-containing protein [Orenia metallireducens]OCL25286.1 sporulation protein [Orenia metallireducens]